MTDSAFFCITCTTEIDPSYKACPHCGEPITDFLRQYLVDPIDGKYKIISRLGIGGMGEVYKVLHLRLNSIRVVKLMRAKLQESDAEARFVREARLATRIHHPNVATLFDFATLPDGTNYMVWEYIEGTNLAEMLRVRGPLPPGECARICIQALEGLEAVHRAGIVHRDISPENIMIAVDESGTPRVKLIDLGIAKHSSDAGEDQTKTGIFVGKWKYCSPEHFGLLDSTESIDARADIYSFGIVMYELLTGRPPFVAQSPQKYLMLHTTENPAPLAEIEPGLARMEALQSVVFRALRKKRADRFHDAGEFRRALEAILDTLPEITEVETLAGTTPIPTRAADGHGVGFEKWLLAPEPAMNTTATTVDEEVLPGVLPEPGSRRKDATLYAAIAALLILAIAVVAYFVRGRAGGDDLVAAKPEAGTVQPAGGTLAVNAYPWAEITRISEVGGGKNVLTARAVTPAALTVSAGEYEIEAVSPQSGETVVERVKVDANGRAVVMLQFKNSQPAGLPDFIEVVQ